MRARFFLFHIEMLFFNLDKDQCLKGEKKLFGVKTTCEYSILNILHYDLNLHQRSYNTEISHCYYYQHFLLISISFSHQMIHS